jgi:hypothetical protein
MEKFGDKAGANRHQSAKHRITGYGTGIPVD